MPPTDDLDPDDVGLEFLPGSGRLGDEEERELLEAWERVERDAAAVLRMALADRRGLEPDPVAVERAGARLRAAITAQDPSATWMRRAAALTDELTWGPAGIRMHDEDLIWECVSATVSFPEDPGLPAEEQASIMSLELADWLGAVIGLVRAGPGSSAEPSTLVEHIESCPEIDGEPLDADEAMFIEHAFELLLPAWQRAGVVDADRCLTELGAWMLPRAVAAAWGSDFDDEDLDRDGHGPFDDDPFGPDGLPYDEAEQRREVIDELCGRFADRCQEQGVDADPDWVAILLDLRLTYLDDRPARWTIGDLSQLLLDIAPPKLSIPGEQIREAMDSLATFLRYLDSEDALADDSDDIDVLAAWLERTQDAAVAAMDDPSRWGPAKALLNAATQEGVDLEDRDAVQAWMQDFNERPFAERDALLSGIGPASHLSPRVLPADAELMSLVQATPIWRQLVGFVTYVRDVLPLTDAGNLKLADARRLVDELGTEDSFDRSGVGRAATIRSSSELAGLTRIFDLATDLELVAVEGRKLRRDSDAIVTFERDPLSAWQQTVTACLADGVLGQRSRFHTTWWVDELDGAVLELLIGLEEDDEVKVTDLAELVLEHDAFGGSMMRTRMSEWVTEDVYRFVDRLASLGLVSLAGVRGGRGGTAPDVSRASVASTPLATLLLSRLAGLSVHRVGQFAEVSAGELLDSLGELSVDVADDEVAAWLAKRPRAAALEELTEAARGNRARAMSAFLVFEHLGADVAGDAVERLADDVQAGPFARAWLVQHGRRSFDVAADAGTDAIIGVLATLAELDTPDALVHAFQQLGELSEQRRFLEEAWRSEQPETAEVLSTIGDLHPDKGVRKAARKAEFKRRSAG